MPLDDFGRDYLRLMLEINKHTAGFVDCYIGPTDIRAEVDNSEKVNMLVIADRLSELESRIPMDDPQRAEYLKAMLRAARTALNLNSEHALDYVEEVRNLYGIEPTLMDEARLVEATHTLEELLPGSGDVNTRRKAYRAHYQIPLDKLDAIITTSLAEVRKRTKEIVDLVEGENLRYELVNDAPWGAYCTILGNGQSLIQFNIDFPIEAIQILDWCAHEGYPGHHTELMLKENHLYQEHGMAEAAIYLLLSPAAMVSEGIATTALEVIFPDNSDMIWEDEVLFPLAGIQPHPIELRKAIKEALKAIQYVSGNVAYLYHRGEINKAQALDYLQTMGLMDEHRAKRSFGNITNPLWRAYIHTYTVGYDLIASVAPADKRPIIKRLLTENVLPSQIASLI